MNLYSVSQKIILIGGSAKICQYCLTVRFLFKLINKYGSLSTMYIHVDTYFDPFGCKFLLWLSFQKFRTNYYFVLLIHFFHSILIMKRCVERNAKMCSFAQKRKHLLNVGKDSCIMVKCNMFQHLLAVCVRYF